MERTVLKAAYRKEILSNAALQGKIARATHKSVASVIRWANTNSEMLLLSPCLDEIRFHLRLSKSETLTEAVIDNSKTLAA